MSEVNVEILESPTQLVTLNDSKVRLTAGISSGTISMNDLRGKSYRQTLYYTYSSSANRASINVSAISGYIAGISDLIITVNSGVVFSSNALGAAAWDISGGTTGDTITINNYGTIYGVGGSGGRNNQGGYYEQDGNARGVGYGGSVPNNPYGDSGGYPAQNGSSGAAGTLAIYAAVGAPITFNNYGAVIGGGGGGGGGGSNNGGGGNGGNGGNAMVKTSNFTCLLNSYGGTFAGGGGGGSGWGNRSPGSTEGGAPGQNGYITNNGGGNFGAQGSSGIVSNYNGTTVYSGTGAWYI